MAGDRLLQQRALNGGLGAPGAAEMRAAEPPGQHIAELCSSDPFRAAAAFPRPSRVRRSRRSQALSPASRDARSHAAPHCAEPRPHAWAQPHSGDLLAGTPVHVSRAHPACSVRSARGSVDSGTRDLASGEENGAPRL